MIELTLMQSYTIAEALIDKALREPMTRPEVADALRALGYDQSADAVDNLGYSLKVA